MHGRVLVLNLQLWPPDLLNTSGSLNISLHRQFEGIDYLIVGITLELPITNHE